MADTPKVTQPGGTNPTMSEGPLRPGLIPKKVLFPFSPSPFYADQLRQVLRRNMPEYKTPVEVHVREKRVVPAGGHGVFKLFSRGH